jgi:anthranilate phosphoribosyltransferase
MHAYILVRLDKARERAAQEDLGSLHEVLEANILFGEWDLLLKLEGKNPQHVGDIVIDKIRSNPDVSLTSTLIVAE